MSTRMLAAPLNIKGWIEEHRHLLKPPAVTRTVWEDRDMMVTVAAGPNHRKDYHINPTEELYFQVEGDITIRIMDDQGRKREIPVREGEMFLLPAHVPHCTQRASGTVGLVIERRRPSGEEDQIRFYCDRCGSTVHEEQFEVGGMQVEVTELLEEFWSDATMRTCMQCGYVVQPPSGPALPPPPGMKADLPPTADASRSARTGGKAKAAHGPTSTKPRASASRRGPTPRSRIARAT